MAEVRLHIASREYIVTCRDGEEDHLVKLGEMVDAKAKEAGGNAAGLNESRLLLFAALLLADETGTANQKAEKASEDLAKVSSVALSGTSGATSSNIPSIGIDGASQKEIDMAAATIEKLAIRIENFAQRLEQSSK